MKRRRTSVEHDQKAKIGTEFRAKRSGPRGPRTRALLLENRPVHPAMGTGSTIRAGAVPAEAALSPSAPAS